MKQVPKYLKHIADCARPDELDAGDYALLASHVKMCWPGLQEWLDDDEFWEAVSVAGFAQQMVPAVAGATGIDKGLANFVVSVIPGPTERAESTRKAVQVMADNTYGFVQLGSDVAASGDPTMPLTILRHLFQATSGGLAIAVAAIQMDAPLSIQSSAFTCGLAAITEASNALRKQLVGKVPKSNEW